MPLQYENLCYVKDLLRSRSGMVLDDSKEYLVENRLMPLSANAGFTKLDDFISHIRKLPGYSGEHSLVVESMTINETFFFRDQYCFEALWKFILPEIIEKRRDVRRLRIWSAASSTGQEAYSIAILLYEKFPELVDWNIEIMGTDLSRAAVEKARAGVYTLSEINRGLTQDQIERHFTRSGNTWRIHPNLKKNIAFTCINLCEPFSYMDQFDIVFLRNVLIYFDQETKKEITRKVGACVASDGFLILGTGESTMFIDPIWDQICYDRFTAYRHQQKQGVTNSY